METSKQFIAWSWFYPVHRLPARAFEKSGRIRVPTHE